MELLVVLSDIRRADVVVTFANDLGEVGWSIKLASVKRSLIAVDNFLDTTDTRVEDVTIEGETVRSSVGVGRDSSAETIEVDLLITIVELQDIAY